MAQNQFQGVDDQAGIVPLEQGTHSRPTSPSSAEFDFGSFDFSASHSPSPDSPTSAKSTDANSTERIIELLDENFLKQAESTLGTIRRSWSLVDASLERGELTDMTLLGQNMIVQHELQRLHQAMDSTIELLSLDGHELAAIGLKSVKHDLNNEANKVIGFYGALRDSLDDPAELRELRDLSIRHNVKESLQFDRTAMLESITLGSARSSGELENLRSVAYELFEELKGSQPSGAAEVTFATRIVDPEAWEELDTKLSVRAITLELVRNALDEMGQSGGHIDFISYSTGDHFCFEVRDSGAGIPADVLPHIFEDSYSTKGKVNGGMGLHIVADALSMLDGKIVVNTSERGTSFKVFIPTPA